MRPDKIIKVEANEETDNENYWYYIRYNSKVIFPIKGYEKYEIKVPKPYLTDKKSYVLSKGKQIE